jgi:hypothetical protein
MNQFFTIVFGFECLFKLYTYSGSGAQFTCFTGTKVLAFLVLKYSTIVKLYTYSGSGAQFACFTGTKVLAWLVQKYFYNRLWV